MTYIERFDRQKYWKYTNCSRCDKYQRYRDCSEGLWYPYYGPSDCGRDKNDSRLPCYVYNEHELFDVIPQMLIDLTLRTTQNKIINDGLFRTDINDEYDSTLVMAIGKSAKLLPDIKKEALDFHIIKKLKEENR